MQGAGCRVEGREAKGFQFGDFHRMCDVVFSMSASKRSATAVCRQDGEFAVMTCHFKRVILRVITCDFTCHDVSFYVSSGWRVRGLSTPTANLRL